MPTRSQAPSSSRLGAAIAVLAMGCAPQLACAQDLGPEERGWEAGARYWWSQGKTQWNHNAQRASPIAGNPTSVLVYDRLYAHSLEFHGAKRWHQGWFITGNAGVGQIYKGNLNDSDYFVGQVKFSETDSSINEGQLGYLTVDGGYEVLRFPGGSTLGFFGGLQYWTETVEARGASGTVNIRNDVVAITNEVRWQSLRVGLAARSRINDKLRVSANVAAVPVSWMTNDDSHHLRTASSDLGPTPNITMEGSGYGFQLDAEARYAIYKSMELGVGARYWKLKASGDISFRGTAPLPLNELESTRYGLTLSLIKRW